MDPTTNHDTPTPSTVMYDPTVGTRGFPSACASLRWLILAFGWSCALPSASGGEALAPSDDPVRGDALDAAVHARDAVRLKGLLRSADRERGATYTTIASAKHGQHMAIDDLYNDAKDGPCLIALLDYGVDIGGAKLGMFADLKPFKDHYPAFLTTAGRSGMDHAAKIGDNALLEKLLALGVAPKESDLAAAVSCSHAGAVKRLLAAGVAKDGTAEFMGKRMTIEEIAVQGMFFAVLDELGAWDRHAAELKLHRAGRAGPGGGEIGWEMAGGRSGVLAGARRFGVYRKYHGAPPAGVVESGRTERSDRTSHRAGTGHPAYG